MRRGLILMVVTPLMALIGCLDAGQTRMVVPLSVAGADRPTITTDTGTTVSLTRADLAFGPLYLCAGEQSGQSCETARFEWLDTVVVDTLDPSTRATGELGGVSGRVQSFMYDLGISSQLVREAPFVLDAAQALGGNSVVIEGTADLGGTMYPFVARLEIQQTSENELGVPVVRSSTDDVFNRDVAPGEPGLIVTFDPAPWLRGVDFNAYAEDDVCVAGRAVVCAGQVEQRCDDAGTTTETRTCPTGTVCVARLGCREQVEIDPDSEAFRSIRTALLAGERPVFSWQD